MGGANEEKYPLDDRGFLKDIQDLKLSYYGTLRLLQSRRREIEELIEAETGMTMEQLGKKEHRSLYKQWKEANHGIWVDLQYVKEMISDVTYVIEWLNTGRRPGNRRGIERRAAYQREKLLDPMKMQAMMASSRAGSWSSITESEREMIEMALCTLSPRERECYEMAHGQGFSFAYIAQMLGISKGAVQEYVERAQEKVSEEVRNNMFLRM